MIGLGLYGLEANCIIDILKECATGALTIGGGKGLIKGVNFIVFIDSF